MSISTKCRKCGRRYNLKDEHAGKKFRCKECEAVVTVPQAEPDGFAADDWGADFGGGDFDDYGDDDDYGSPLPPPRPRKIKPAAKKKRPAKKKSSRSRSDGGQGAKIGGGIFAALVVLGIVVKVLSAVGLDLGSWSSYTTPDGNITVLMPGKVKKVPVPAHRMAAGGESYGAERRQYACIIIIEPMPPEIQGLTEEQIYNAMKLGGGSLGWSNAAESTMNGHRCVTFELSKAGINAKGAAFIHKNKVYTLHYAYKGSNASNAKKFFDSVQFN